MNDKNPNEMLFEAKTAKETKAAIDAGADVNVKNKSGQTPLKEAIACRRKDVVRLLLEAGAYPRNLSENEKQILTEYANKDKQIAGFLKRNMKELENHYIQPDKMHNIDFQIDTIADTSIRKRGNYSSDRNTITINHKRDDKDWNEINIGEMNLIHEQKHRDNQLKGIDVWPVGLEQAYKLNMHNEISANIAELIFLRQKYLETGDLAVFDSKKTYFSFYKNAVACGEVDPYSSYQEDFDKDMSLIMNGTKKMWLEEFATDVYVEQNVSNALNQADIMNIYIQYHNQNYENGKKIAYNIGGVDFTKYMDKDVEVSAEVKEILKKGAKEKLSQPSNSRRFLEERMLSPWGNQQINPVNTYVPQYRSWQDKDGYRVSKVQYKQILNMNEDVIRKPTMSYAQEKIKQRQKIKDSLKQAGIRQTKVSPNNTSKQQSGYTQTNGTIDATLPQTKKHTSLQAVDTKTKLKRDEQISSEIIKGINAGAVIGMNIGAIKGISSGAADIKNLKEQMKQTAQQAQNEYRLQMIKMIRHMNKTGGENKSMDAEKTTDILCQKYGDKAYDLLLKAIQEPDDYSEITGDRDIKTSRSAVQHLCNMNNDASARNIIKNLLKKEK